ncbi:alanine--tRNA ligase, mitochondrial isoform X1 [Neodiprion virginianus]|uniref:alanine--tRNA ligase, mitochondrial isoform X1 n=2 Tax=Neodiprion virginianus TaxID=2961670 RepID=UPI001EE7449C|nr:alanine--tRNA ligase, mitochondrial isoform X1 [Neodiprion virginianus]
MNKTMIARFYSKKLQNVKSSHAIRKEFIDFFTRDLNHKYIRSSPVLPLCDPTVAFVNAGMNQFKGVFLGHLNPPAKRVANSQKCIRIGGKHNDLDAVGQDTYHHTFFEMLGNWSFGDYFKEEACEFAWKLLTGPYGINESRLYVTYFAGDEKMGLKPDLECKDIWLRLGVSQDRILPFGSQDNFWEMGTTGPCGPCTEIHIDHTMQTSNQASRVNRGHADLTELWNIVFIEYQRLSDGPIVPLPKKHIDTGMGFERLVAVLQGKRSNYDTDLFQPLFDTIKKKTNAPEYQGRFMSADKNGIDTAYRTLADHARMITIALADGMLPDQNHKLRKVLRKAVDVGEKVFQQSGLLHELSFRVADNLGNVYPEIQKNLKQVQKLIAYEEDLLKSLRDTAGTEWKRIIKTRSALASVSNTTAPGLAAAYKDLQSSLFILASNDKFPRVLPPDIAFKMYDTYGLDPDTISELAKVESLSFDKNEFNNELNNARQRSKMNFGKVDEEIVSQESLQLLEKNNVPTTDDSAKYSYTVTDRVYYFPPVNCKLLGMIVGGKLISETQSHVIDDSQSIIEATVMHSGNIVEIDSIIDANATVGLILDKTPFYSPEGGQGSDVGQIQVKNVIFDVKEVRKICNYVFHIGKFIVQDGIKPEAELHVGDECVATINEKTRLGLMRHHTSTHLINAALHKILPATGQRGSNVAKDSLDLQFSVFGEKLSPKDIETVETLINKSINADVAVKTRTIDALGLTSEENITLVPGEVYPDTGIRIVEIIGQDLQSIEACCGTHVQNTGALEHLCILKVKSLGTGSQSIRAIAGPIARLARQAGENVKQQIILLEEDINTGNAQFNLLDTRVQDIKRQLMDRTERIPLPYSIKHECVSRLEMLARNSKSQERSAMKESIENELKSVVQSCTLPFVVHCFQPVNVALESVSLQKVTKFCSNTPTLVIAHNKEMVKARCSVPKEMASSEFNAQLWMQTVLPIFKAHGSSPKGQDPLLIQHMKSKRVSDLELKGLVERAVIEATKFAALHVKKSRHQTK